MLDSRMIYSCGYWRNAGTLDEAQEAKLELVARKLGLQAGMRVLDVGCGWGGTLAYFAERHGISGVGMTVSRQQLRWARKRYAHLPLEFRVEDYRVADPGVFDRVYSIGMFEHVGAGNYPLFFRRMRDFLAPDGWLLLHTIGGLTSRSIADPWISKHIFPNSVLPAAEQIASAVAGHFVIEDWHNFGADYDPTLMSWYDKFRLAWPMLRPHYDERFRRMWEFYLLTCAGFFRARQGQLWQLVLAPRGVPGGYRMPRIR
jgi:cyclopropane-fatty-acyl-phospholipid synthase